MTDPQIQEVLDKVADYIEEHGWTREEYANEITGAVCILGALSRVLTPSNDFRIDADRTSTYCVVNQELQERALAQGAESTIYWNDCVAKDQDEVIRFVRGKSLDE